MNVAFANGAHIEVSGIRVVVKLWHVLNFLLV